jgi:polar amino acid transport system substrate-binding protein
MENDAAASQTADTGETVSEVLEDGVLTVGTNAEFPPFEYTEDGEVKGFDIALIRAIGERLGVDVEVENMEFDSLLGNVGSKIDVAVAAMTITEDRSKSVDFSDSYYEAVQYVMVSADSAIAAEGDLDGKTIGVQLGTTGDYVAAGIKNAKTAQYSKASDAVNDLISGRVEAVIIDKNPAEYFLGKFEEKVKIIDGQNFDFAPEEYAIALPKGDEALANAINEALAEIKTNGVWDELVSEYLDENE